MMKHIWICSSVLLLVSHGLAMQHRKPNHGLHMKMGKMPHSRPFFRPQEVCQDELQPRVDAAIAVKKQSCVATPSIFERVGTFLGKALMGYLLFSTQVLAQKPYQPVQIIPVTPATGGFDIQNWQDTSCYTVPISTSSGSVYGPGDVCNHMKDAVAHCSDEWPAIHSDVYFDVALNPALPLSPIRKCWIANAQRAFAVSGYDNRAAVIPRAYDAAQVQSGVGAFNGVMKKSDWRAQNDAVGSFYHDMIDYVAISDLAVVIPNPQLYGSQFGAMLHEMWHLRQWKETSSAYEVVDGSKYPRGIEQEADTEALLYLAAHYCPFCAKEFADGRFSGTRPRLDGYLTMSEAHQILADFYQTHTSSVGPCDYHKGINPLSGKPLSIDPLDINS